MQTVNGIGRTLYGRENLPNSYFYIATEWIVFFWVPIFPIKSYIVISESLSTYTANIYSTSYTLQKTNLNLKQISFIYFFESLIMTFILFLTEKYLISALVLLLTIGIGYCYLWLKHGTLRKIIDSFK